MFTLSRFEWAALVWTCVDRIPKKHELHFPSDRQQKFTLHQVIFIILSSGTVKIAPNKIDISSSLGWVDFSRLPSTLCSDYLDFCSQWLNSRCIESISSSFKNFCSIFTTINLTAVHQKPIYSFLLSILSSSIFIYDYYWRIFISS